MSVDRSSVRTNTQHRPNYFQGNGKPSFIVEELHNQDEPFVGDDDSHETDYEHLENNYEQLPYYYSHDLEQSFDQMNIEENFTAPASQEINK
nr:unnamed protein product [Callosobruchus chinensis]